MKGVKSLSRFLLGLIFLGVLSALVMVILSGCKKPEPQDLPFETLAKGGGFHDVKNYEGTEPKLLIIAESDDISTLDLELPQDLLEQLNAVDYSRDFAILVLEGEKGFTTENNVTVTKIQRQGNRVTIYAEFPLPGSHQAPAFSSPCHLISVSKDGKWRKTIQFELVTIDETVAETRHFIP